MSLELDALRRELAVKAKCGIDFLLAASVVWAAIAWVWAQPGSATRHSFITFFLGGLLLPLAWVFSKVLRTTWALPHNPLHPLGLWLNFAQFFYLPFLFFVYSHQPAYFPMTYGIITGAHFFPYAWYYAAPPYAVMAGVLPVGCWLLALRTAASAPYWVPVFVAGMLLLLAAWLYGSYRQRRAAYQPAA